MPISKLLLLSLSLIGLHCTKSENVTPKSAQSEILYADALSDSQSSNSNSDKLRQVQTDSILTGQRSNAITKAVETISKAVVSISVTELVKERDRLKMDVFYGLFVEP